MCKFALVWIELKQLGMGYREFAERLGVSLGTINLRMAGKQPWTDWEMYKALDLFKAPDNRLHEYFPRRLNAK